MACQSCSGRFQLIRWDKLGNCEKCMRQAGFGTLAGWILFFIVYVAWSYSATWLPLLLIASAFTVLWLSHIGVLLNRARLSIKYRERAYSAVRRDIDARSQDRIFLTLVRIGIISVIQTLFGMTFNIFRNLVRTALFRRQRTSHRDEGITADFAPDKVSKERMREMFSRQKVGVKFESEKSNKST